MILDSMQRLSKLMMLLIYCAFSANKAFDGQHGSAKTQEPVTPNLAAAVALPINLFLSQLSSQGTDCVYEAHL